MKENKCEGIVLQSYPFKESRRIIHLFTYDQGIIHLIVKSLSPKNSQLINLTTPFCQGYYLFRKGKSTLYTFIDGSIIDLHLSLRQSLNKLNLGSKMLQAIHHTQLPEKPSPKLYKLLTSYLKKLPVASTSIWASFQLKLLKHEGYISFEKPFITSPHNTYMLTNKEWTSLILLSEERYFSNIVTVIPSISLQKTIEDIFSSFIKR